MDETVACSTPVWPTPTKKRPLFPLAQLRPTWWPLPHQKQPQAQRVQAPAHSFSPLHTWACRMRRFALMPYSCAGTRAILLVAAFVQALRRWTASATAPISPYLKAQMHGVRPSKRSHQPGSSYGTSYGAAIPPKDLCRLIRNRPESRGL